MNSKGGQAEEGNEPKRIGAPKRRWVLEGRGMPKDAMRRGSGVRRARSLLRTGGMLQKMWYAKTWWCTGDLVMGYQKTTIMQPTKRQRVEKVQFRHKARANLEV